MSKKSKEISLPIGEVHTDYFVRKKLNEDHVLFLAELYEAGESLPRIQICEEDGKYQVVDGRHRLEAHYLLDKTHIDCEVIEIEDIPHLLSYGLKANSGGSLPPSPDDIVMVIKRMFEAGKGRRSIVKLLSEIYPKEVCKKYVDDAAHELRKAAMRRAINAVAGGDMTAKQAAKEFGVELKKLKEQISGKTPKRSKTLPNLKSAISRAQQGHTRRTTNNLRKAIEAYEDGELSVTEVKALFTHVEGLHLRSLRTYKDLRKRFEAATANNNDN